MDEIFDSPPEPGRQDRAIADGIVACMQGFSILCGENFLTHDEHRNLITQLDDIGRRWLAQKDSLDRLDFEP